jgi:hypothetical protein
VSSREARGGRPLPPGSAAWHAAHFHLANPVSSGAVSRARADLRTELITTDGDLLDVTAPIIRSEDAPPEGFAAYRAEAEPGSAACRKPGEVTR